MSTAAREASVRWLRNARRRGMAKRYRGTLTQAERQELEQLISHGKADARKLTHARILLQADESDGGPKCIDDEVADSLESCTRTVERVRERFVEQGLEA